jgi:ribosomal-protein-alanine N-acetyltransferase
MQEPLKTSFAKATVRQARAADLPAIAAAENASYPPDQRWSEAVLGSWIPAAGESPSHYAMIVAVPEGAQEAAGYIIAEISEDDDRAAEVLCLTVNPSQRRLGLGRALLEAVAESLCEQSGVEKIILEARAENTGAIRLYEEAGFTKVADLPGYYKDFGGNDGIRMTRAARPRQQPSP